MKKNIIICVFCKSFTGPSEAGGVNCLPTFAENKAKLVNSRQILAFGFDPPLFSSFRKAFL